MSSSTVFTLKGKVWLWPGENPWYMVNLPKDKSNGIRKLFQGLTGGFGSLPVKATIGLTTWRTSIFPESKNGAYMLPLKKAVRKNENIHVGDTISFSLQILV